MTIQSWQPDDAQPPVDKSELTLLIIGGNPATSQVEWSKEWLASGGRILFAASSAEQSTILYELIGQTPQSVAEADVIDYSMLNSVDFTHPVLAPFNDPRFADFSKLRFWKHREFDIQSLPEHRTLASFENGSPAIFEFQVEAGRLIAFAAGWNRTDSDLAVWSKFVPMMNGLLEYLGGQRNFRPVYYVGDQIGLKEFGFSEQEALLKTPSGVTISLTQDEPLLIEIPGIYSIGLSAEELSKPDSVRFAVNLPPDESKTDPLSMDLFRSAGVPVASASSLKNTPQPDAATERQLMNRELESKQQLWKWLLVAAICILLFESALAGWKQRQPQSA